MIVVIPARYASTRFPGKALADLGGKSVLRRCYEQVAKVVATDSIIVATDDQRIVDECNRYDMKSMITSAACLTGTDRVAEVARQITADWYINVQGDEPFLNPDGLRQLIRFTETASADLSIINACAPIGNEADFRSVTVPKVVRDLNGNLLYISRAAIPTTKSLQFKGAYRQVGLYAFRAVTLQQFAKQPDKTPLEALEDVEILRFIELGFRVAMIEVQENGIAIDTPEDLERAKQFLATT
jgi:3-deoxy-manno-octulosonate cytidylyltransferase (CMP-KDO synthetase)